MLELYTDTPSASEASSPASFTLEPPSFFSSSSSDSKPKGTPCIAIEPKSTSLLSDVKPFDPFDATYFSDLISTTTAPSRECSVPSLSSSSSSSLSPASPTRLLSSWPQLMLPAENDEIWDVSDEIDKGKGKDDKDQLSLHYLIDMDLLGDYATDIRSGFETSHGHDHQDQQHPSPHISHSTIGCHPVPNKGGAADKVHHYHHWFHLPLLYMPTDAACSAHHHYNIWSSTFHRRQLDPFDEDDPFDPTQPYLSPSFASSTPSLPPSTLSSSSSSSSELLTPFPKLASERPVNANTNSAIDVLLDFFPQLTEEKLTSSMAKVNYDMDQFLSVMSANDDASVFYTKKRQVCRHYLLGECHRQDCRFAHDISIKVCRFWLQGACLKGYQCEFAHSMEPILKQYNYNTGRRKENDLGQYHQGQTDVKQKRRHRKKSKRKSSNNSSSNKASMTSLFVPPTDASTLRHEKYPLDEEFPALLSSFSIKSSTPTSTPSRSPPVSSSWSSLALSMSLSSLSSSSSSSASLTSSTLASVPSKDSLHAASATSTLTNFAQVVAKSKIRK